MLDVATYNAFRCGKACLEIVMEAVPDGFAAAALRGVLLWIVVNGLLAGMLLICTISAGAFHCVILGVAWFDLIVRMGLIPIGGPAFASVGVVLGVHAVELIKEMLFIFDISADALERVILRIAVINFCSVFLIGMQVRIQVAG